jgi:hypothetical protein
MPGRARRVWKLKWAPKPGRRRLDERHDYEEALERIRVKYEETHASERELERLTGESRTMVRLALGRPLKGRRNFKTNLSLPARRWLKDVALEFNQRQHAGRC